MLVTKERSLYRTLSLQLTEQIDHRVDHFPLNCGNQLANCCSNCMYLVPCKLTTIRFPHTAKVVQTSFALSLISDIPCISRNNLSGCHCNLSNEPV